MKSRDLVDLFLLAAIWGSSFLFMRVTAPVFGPVALAFVRVAGAALLLLPLLFWRGEARAMARQWPGLLVLGLCNSALPFMLFGYALLTLPAALSAIFNAATPLATAVIAWAWLADKPTRWRAVGLVIGFAGVVGLALHKSLAHDALHGLRGLQFDSAAALAIAACLAGTLLYGFSANFAKRHLQGTPAMAMATGTQFSAALLLALPAVWTWPQTVTPSATDWLMALTLALLCSGVAYVLYFRLIRNVGPTQASAVTFLVPVFAALFGVGLLNEPVGPPMLVGGAVIIAGTALVLGLLPRPRARQA